MYWILNVIPLAMQILIMLFSRILNKASEFNIIAFIGYFAWTLTIVPIYLLIVNLHFIKNGKVSYVVAFLCMALIVALRIFMGLMNHKMQHGEMIGDVPVQIYQIELIVTLVIIAVSLVIHYFVKGKLN